MHTTQVYPNSFFMIFFSLSLSIQIRFNYVNYSYFDEIIFYV